MMAFLFRGTSTLDCEFFRRLRHKPAAKYRWLFAVMMAFIPCWEAYGQETPRKPNIVVILADDLGYGDVSCLNPKSKIQTPHLDRLAKQGMTLTDAHSPSAVCTPTRYGLLTGQYAWRTRLNSGVLYGWSPPLIDNGRLTLASMLKRAGYTTACIGKWHLGLDWQRKADKKAAKDDGWQYDYALPFKNGPTTLGFDEFYGISASLDMPPYVYLEQDRATAIPTVEKTWVRKGPAAKDFDAVDVLPATTAKAVDFIARQAARAKGDPKKAEPFFLYLPLTSPHTPTVPTAKWKGKSAAGDYGDFVIATDDAVGQILAALDEHGLTNNTLVIFTSDNGAAPYVVVALEQMFGHFSSGLLRGYKADAWEGGHRVPFFARWPGQIPAGSTSDQTACHVDLLATCAAVAGQDLPKSAGDDSFNLLPVLRGDKLARPVRDATILHSMKGVFAVRQDNWILILDQGGGGFSNAPKAKKDEPPFQLFDLANDLSQKTNLARQNPEIVQRLQAILERAKTSPTAPHTR